MNKIHLNTYLNFIDNLINCPRGQEWCFLLQCEHLIDRELLIWMERFADRSDIFTAQFLHSWAIKLGDLLDRQQVTATTSICRAERYLQLIQRLLCNREKRSSILEFHPELIDEGLIYTIDRVATKLSDRGRRDLAIYLQHLTADIRQIVVNRGQSIVPQTAPKSITTYIPCNKDLSIDLPISIAA